MWKFLPWEKFQLYTNEKRNEAKWKLAQMQFATKDVGMTDQAEKFINVHM